MRTSKSLAVGVVLMAAVAVLAPVSGSAFAAPSVHRPAVMAITLSNEDNGRVLGAQAGDTFRVILKGSQGGGATWAWSVPKTDAAGVLNRTLGSVLPNGDALGEFEAGASGVSDISSLQRCIPDPGYLCPQVVIPWKVTVVVR